MGLYPCGLLVAAQHEKSCTPHHTKDPTMKRPKTQALTLTPLFVTAALFLLGMLAFTLAEIVSKL